MRLTSGLVLISLHACASAPPAKRDPEVAINAVEQTFRQASSALDQGDRKQAEALLAKGEAEMIHAALDLHPDRHQLEAFRDEIKQRLDGRGAPLVAVSEVVKETPPPEPDPLPLESAAAERSDDAVDAFRDGPLEARKRGWKILRKAKRTSSKRRSRRLFARARVMLDSCVNEGGRLVDDAPALVETRFRVGARRLTADRIVSQCRSKMKWIDRKLKRRKRRSRRG